MAGQQINSKTRRRGIAPLAVGLVMVSSTVAAEEGDRDPGVPYGHAVEIFAGHRGPRGQAALVASLRLARPLLASVGVGIRTYELPPQFADDLVAPTYLVALRLQRRIGGGLFGGVGLGFSTGADWEDAPSQPGTSGAFWSWKLRNRVDATLALEWDFVPVFLRAEVGLSRALDPPDYCPSCIPGTEPSPWIPFFGLSVGQGGGRQATAEAVGENHLDEGTSRALLTPTALTSPAGTFRVELLNVLGVGFVYAPVERIELGATFLLPLFRNHQIALAIAKARLITVGPLSLAAAAGGWYFHSSALASEIWGGGLLASFVNDRAVLTVGAVVGHVFQDQDEGHRLDDTRFAFLASALFRLAPILSAVGELWTDRTEVEGGVGLRLHFSRCDADLGVLIDAEALTTPLSPSAVPWLRVGCRR